MSLLRLDTLDTLAPGNKIFKLQAALARAGEYDAVLSFGGAWSNHLHALAAMGAARGFATVGVVRGQRPPRLSAMLEDAQRWGMKLVFVSRADYKNRNDPVWQQALARPFGHCLIVPEGGADINGVRGCMAIGDVLSPCLNSGDTVMLAVGTGATLAGVVASVSGAVTVQGVSVLKGAAGETAEQVSAWLAALGIDTTVRWNIRSDAHEGGYAKVSPGLREFILAFEAVQGVPLEPVYTGKLLYRIYRDLKQGQAHGSIVALHTGGLQGRRGFDF